MRCLHCGKAIPLFKRLSGGEFCSDAHRRDYQQEYSQLALSRLLQARPQSQKLPSQTPPSQIKDRSETVQTEAKHSTAVISGPQLAGTSLAAEQNESSLVNSRRPVATPAAIRSQPEAARATGNVTVTERATNGLVANDSAVNRAPAGSARAMPAAAAAPAPQAAPVARGAEAATSPGMANPVIRKPAAASPELTMMVLPESEMLVNTVTPQRPSRQAALGSTRLPYAVPAAWGRTCEIQNSTAHLLETRVALRSFARSAPVIDFDLRIGGPKAWSLAEQPVEIPVVRVASPAGPALWQAPLCDFTRLTIALGDFVDLPLRPIGTEEASGGAENASSQSGPRQPAKPEEPQDPTPASRDLPAPAASLPAPAASLPAPAASLKEQAIPKELLKPLPVVSKGIAAGRAKPVQVFNSWVPNPQTTQIAPSEALPLRPVMVLAPAEKETPQTASPAPTDPLPDARPLANGKSRKADVRILPPEKLPPEKLAIDNPAAPDPAPMKSSVSIAVSVAASVKRDELGLPEFRMQPSGSDVAARIWTKIAGLRGRK